MYRQELIHVQDLKGANVLVDLAGVCKISDSGCSTRVENAEEYTVMEGMGGTIFWMAPEVVNMSQRGCNSKMDIWSFGCVVLEMWTGQRPWPAEESVTVTTKLHNRQAPPIAPHILSDEAARNFVLACFAPYVTTSGPVMSEGADATVAQKS